jgi:hypothetical protein
VEDPVPVPVEVLRETVASRLGGETSLRALAQEIGVSPSRLRGFVQGRRPYARTLERLHAWSLRGGSTDLGTATPPEIAEVLTALVARVGPERRAGTRAALLATLRLLRDAHPERAPSWLAEVARTQGDAPSGDAAAGERSAR